MTAMSVTMLTFGILVTGLCQAEDKAPEPAKAAPVLTLGESFPELVPGQQGIATDGAYVYVQSTLVLAKYDMKGQLVKQTEQLEWHHGGITCHEGRIYAAASECCREGTDKHWVFVYDAETLEKVAEHDIAAHFTVCAGGIAYFDGHFYVAESYYDNDHPDYIVEFDKDFKFITTFTVNFKSPYGIQGLDYLPERGKFMVNSHGKPFYLIGPDFDNSTIEIGEAPYALQDVACLGEGRLVLNDRPGKRIVFGRIEAPSSPEKN